MVGPAKVLFLDEISTGLDSSTTFLIVKCIRNAVKAMRVGLSAVINTASLRQACVDLSPDSMAALLPVYCLLSSKLGGLSQMHSLAAGRSDQVWSGCRGQC